jgi:translocator protein
MDDPNRSPQPDRDAPEDDQQAAAPGDSVEPQEPTAEPTTGPGPEPEDAAPETAPDAAPRRIRIRAAAEEPLGARPKAVPAGTTRDRAWLVWPLISLVGLAAVVIVNWLANWLPLNDMTTGQISENHPVPFQPAGWVFSIWIVIYALLAVFVIYSFVPRGRRSTRINAVGPVFLIANIANISWVFLWHWLRFQGALVALVVLLGAVATIYLMLRAVRHDMNLSAPRRLAVALPFSVYLAWSIIATLANVEVWMREGGWDGGIFGLRGWTVIFLLAGIIVAAGVAFFGHDAAFPLVFAWAYLGIAQRQWDDDRLLSILAVLLVVAAAALTVMAILLSFDTRTGPRMETTPRGPIWKRGRDTTPSTP